jgi:sulfur carrier protein
VISVNGAPNSAVAAGSSVRGLLDVLGLDADARGIAVAVDREVVPRGEWASRTLDDGARVEVLTAVQGG